MIRHLRRRRRRVVQLRRRRLLMAAGAAALALTATLGVASFTGTDLAGAAETRANDLMKLIADRSPGARIETQLTKTRKMAVAPPEGFTPPIKLPIDFAQLLALPPATEVPVEIAAAAPPAMMFAPPPGGIFFSPPGGGGGPPGGGGGPPGGGGGTPPGSPPILTPQTPGAVPEPGTWMTMLLGFGLMGWTIRRQRPGTAKTGVAK